MQNSIHKIILFFLLLLLLFSPACRKERVDTDKNTELTELKITQANASLLYLPLYLAIDLGYFKEEGLSILLETTASKENALQSLLSANTSLLIGSPVTAFYHLQQENAAPIVFLAQAASKSGY